MDNLHLVVKIIYFYFLGTYYVRVYTFDNSYIDVTVNGLVEGKVYSSYKTFNLPKYTVNPQTLKLTSTLRSNDEPEPQPGPEPEPEPQPGPEPQPEPQPGPEPSEETPEPEPEEPETPTLKERFYFNYLFNSTNSNNAITNAQGITYCKNNGNDNCPITFRFDSWNDCFQIARWWPT